MAIELKVARFEPEYLGKLGFYLEARDRDVKKPQSNYAEVVEYVLSRSWRCRPQHPAAVEQAACLSRRAVKLNCSMRTKYITSYRRAAFKILFVR